MAEEDGNDQARHPGPGRRGLGHRPWRGARPLRVVGWWLLGPRAWPAHRQGQGHGICRSFVFPGTPLTGCLQCELPGPWKEEPCGAEPSSGVMGARERRHSQIPGVLEVGVWGSGIYLEMFLIYFYCLAASNANVGKERGACNSSIACSLSLMSLLIPCLPRGFTGL